MQTIGFGPAAYPLAGHACGRGRTPDDKLFFIDHTGKVLGARGADTKELVGENLFKRYAVCDGELQMLTRTLMRGEHTIYLMQGRDTPMLVMRALFPGASCLAVALPSKEVGKVLRKPAAYGELFLREFALSPHSAAATAPVTEQGYRLVQDWIHPYCHAFSQSTTGEFSVSDLILLSTRRVVALASLVGCDVSYHFSNISYGNVRSFNAALLLSLLAASLLLANDLGVVEPLCLHYTAREDGTPVLHVSMKAEASSLPPLLEPFAAAALARGMVFSFGASEEQAGVLHIEADLCSKELPSSEFRAAQLFCLPRF